MVCRALSKAHAVGIVHRDLKPENVFLVWDDEDGADVAKVVDFGIAKFTEPTGPTSATRTGSVLGTPYYMSPEQARGLRSVDYRSDLWSVGVIAFRCITGRLPFEGEAVGDVLVKLCTEPIPVPSSYVPDIPPGFDAWLLRALGREPEARFQSAAELGRSLAIVCGLTTPLTPSSGEQFALGSQPGMTPARAPYSPFAATTPSPAVTPPLAAQTGAPITQTPSPLARSQKSTLAVVLLAAVAVLSVGFGVATKLLSKGDPVGASAAPPVATSPASLPAPAAPAPAPSPAVQIATAAATVPNAPTASATAAAVAPVKPTPAAFSQRRPAPPRPSKGKPTATPSGATPAPKPVSDIGF